MVDATEIRWGGWLELQQRMLRGTDRLALRLRRPGPAHLAAHLETGIRGEEEALFYLRRRGYTIVARRWSTTQMRGDVDLIGWDGQWLCFIEVKTRTARDVVPAEMAVDGAKQEMLRRLARVYLKPISDEQRRQILVRFDVVSVYLTPEGGGKGVDIELIQQAFPRQEGFRQRNG